MGNLKLKVIHEADKFKGTQKSSVVGGNSMDELKELIIKGIKKEIFLAEEQYAMLRANYTRINRFRELMSQGPQDGKKSQFVYAYVTFRSMAGYD